MPLSSIFKLFSSKAVPGNDNPIMSTQPIGAYRDIKSYAAGDGAKVRSMALIAASRNAVQIATASIRLYYTRGTGQPVPKNFPFRIVSKAQNGPEIIEITEHPALDLLDKCNPFRNHHDFFEETSLFCDCTGDAYWWIKFGALNTPVELWLLDSSKVTIVPDETKFIKGYYYGTGARRVFLDPSEVVHFRMPSMTNQFYGMGRVEKAFWAISTEQERQKYEGELFLNKGVSELVVRYPQGRLDARQRRDIANQWNMELKTQRGVHITDGEFAIEKIAFSPREMVAMQSHEWNIEEIVGAFGQPKALFADNPNRASIEGALYQWGKFELDPSLARMAEKLNESFFPLFDERLWCAFDPVAMRDKEFDLRQEAADLSGHVRSVNEVRTSRNLEPLDDPRADDPFALATPAVSLIEPDAGNMAGKPPESPDTATKPQGGNTAVDGRNAVASAAVAGNATVSDTALNGAQVSSLIEVVRAVAEGILSVEAAIGLIMVAFPTVDEEEAKRILSTPIKPPAPPAPDIPPVPPKPPEPTKP